MHHQLIFIFLFLRHQIHSVRGSVSLLPDVGNISDSDDAVVKNCISAYNQTLDCTEHVRFVRNYYQYQWTNDKLAALCTSQCFNSVDTWQTGVRTSCDEDNLPFIVGGSLYKGSVYAEKLRYGLDMVCMKSKDLKTYGNWCQNEVEKWHTNLKPSFKNADHGEGEQEDLELNLPSHETTGLLSAYPKSVLCSSCFFDRLEIQATTSSSNWSPALANDYASLGQLCSKTSKKVVRDDKPLVQRSLAVAKPVDAETPTVAVKPVSCEGESLAFLDTDTPLSLSNNLIISTAELLHSNGIPLTGANILIPWKKLMPNQYRACVPPACEILRVDKGESCEDIINAAQTTAALFFAWNPHLIGNCASGLAELQNVCVGPPGGRYELPNPVFENNPHQFYSAFPMESRTSMTHIPYTVTKTQENMEFFTTLG
ncbi:hypothetical protein TWF506_009250 [Arthrobotrys conoides]|uniref:LysM domain-containing protein n=1 Tax=Arthrobotrys conoides TaxID=74498 RepID=A0AAN8RTG2_9PEZI